MISRFLVAIGVCSGVLSAQVNLSENTNPASAPAIQWIQDYLTYNPYALVGTSSIFDVHGIALTAGGLTPQPQIISDDPNISLAYYWAGVDNEDTDDSQINVSYTISDGARVGLTR